MLFGLRYDSSAETDSLAISNCDFWLFESDLTYKSTVAGVVTASCVMIFLIRLRLKLLSLVGAF